MKNGKTVVLIQGSYDILNWGHCKSFEFCKQLGEYLIVALNSQNLLRSYKKREPVLPWEQKKYMIESNKFVDEVIEAPDFSPLELLKEHDVDVFVITEEWLSTKDEEIKYMEEKGGKVEFSPRFPGVVPTSKIKEILLKESKEGFMD